MAVLCCVAINCVGFLEGLRKMPDYCTGIDCNNLCYLITNNVNH